MYASKIFGAENMTKIYFGVKNNASIALLQGLLLRKISSGPD